MNVVKSGTDISIIDNNKILKILFGGNLDLYWCLFSDLENNEYKTFKITKENYYVYQLFEELYNNICNCNVFEVSSFEEEFTDTEEELKILYEDKELLNKSLKKSSAYRNIFDGESIIWHSDEDCWDDADIVKITKEDDMFLLEFIKQEKEDDFLRFNIPGMVSIRFRNSGSMYDPFNIVFMKMYNKLGDYDPCYHQIHMEEFAYKNKIKFK